MSTKDLSPFIKQGEQNDKHGFSIPEKGKEFGNIKTLYFPHS